MSLFDYDRMIEIRRQLEDERAWAKLEPFATAEELADMRHARQVQDDARYFEIMETLKCRRDEDRAARKTYARALECMAMEQPAREHVAAMKPLDLSGYERATSCPTLPARRSVEVELRGYLDACAEPRGADPMALSGLPVHVTDAAPLEAPNPVTGAMEPVWGWRVGGRLIVHPTRWAELKAVTNRR